MGIQFKWANAMQQYSTLFIDGEWRAATSGDHLELVNPATGVPFARVASASAQDVDTAVQAARKALPAWSAMAGSQRAAILRRIADGMQQRHDELTAAVSDTMGCPRHIAAWLQIDGPIEGIRLFADLAEQLPQREVMGHSLVLRESAGVCAFINPWNYPLHQFVGKVGAALAAGCTMLVKPSEQTPLQDIIMADIMQQAGLPAGVFNLLPGTGIEVGQAMCRHPDVDVLSFTGSTRAGIAVSQSAADTVKRVALELGGKSPLIITECADLETAVRFGVDDVMINSGQTCTALTRMLVPRSRYAEAKKIAAEHAVTLRLGMDEEAFLGPISSRAQQQKIIDYINIGLEEGAELLCGHAGQARGQESGFYVEPCIFAEVNNGMRIAREEIFGPVLCMIAYDSEEEAIAIANNSPYGLSSGVYAGNDEKALAIAQQLRAGLCFANGGEFNYQAPFGGVKQSGNGREFSMQGVEEFLETKSIQLPADSELLQ